jgi:hypothetical protein
MSVDPLSKLYRGARRASVITFAVATIATTTVTGEVVVASLPSTWVPAQAAPPACPAAVPANSLTAGQPLTGLTVDQ